MFISNFKKILPFQRHITFRLNKECPKFIIILLFLSFYTSIQHADAQENSKDSLKKTTDTIHTNQNQIVTRVHGFVTDAANGKPLSLISISLTGSHYGIKSDNDGKFELSAPGSFKHVIFSYIGYQSVTKTIKPGQSNELQIQLHSSQTQLKGVSIISGKKVRYRNKGNPAVELIQQVIDHKNENRMESADYLQYDQYERIGLTLFHLSPKFINGRFFAKYKFMLDTATKINGQTQTSLPVYFNEKLSQNFFRKDPEKSIHILKAENGINIIKFIDTAGLDIYLNRLYGNNIDLYSNNIFVIADQFLSPIADHSPDFYKFFITDTIKSATGNLVEVSFTPRVKGDLLFEGKLLVTQDGHYAVSSCELNINKQVNINFMRSLKITLDFEKADSGRYNLRKSKVAADFGVLRDKGLGVFGERTVVFSNYKLNSPQPASFYQGKSNQNAVVPGKADTGFWAGNRTDTLTHQEAQTYARINRLENMPSFKKATWIASTLTGGYADLGPVQLGVIGEIFSFDKQEGARFQLGARTTPAFNKTIYLNGYAAYGTKDQQFKYELNTYFSLNKTPPYRFPNDYFKIGYLYDVYLPGHSFAISNNVTALTSFSTGKTDYWLYSKLFTVAYVKDFENHFSYNLAFQTWNQQPAGTLNFLLNDQNDTPVHDMTTTELDLGLRYAPHEQFIQGTEFRHRIYSKYPIYNLHISHGFAGVLNGAYDYTNITANIYKRFYFSQLGYSDITLLGNMLIGKVPFPLLNISPANQSLAYDEEAYNKMYYLEFVSDHYVGLNLTQSFNGFILNKIPLIQHLKWREFLSFKILYGGLRNENNPLYSKNLYQFPTASNGANGTYGLGNVPYIEAGAGIGNIFKILRVDVIRRFNYLDHPGISQYGIKFSFSPDF